MRKLVLFAIIVIVLIFLVIWFIGTLPPSTEEIMKSENPTDWIKTEEGNSVIDVEAATLQSQVPYSQQQRYITPEGEITAIFYDGRYKGQPFTGTYIEDDKILMRIFPDMKPNDGIIEGYAFLREENSKFVLYLFIDDDWRKSSRNQIFISWGEDIKVKQTFKSKQFEFGTGANGIFLDKLEGIDFLVEQNPVRGRVFLGEITLADIRDKNYNNTFIMIT